MFRLLLIVFPLTLLLLLFAESTNYNITLDEQMWLMPCDNEIETGITPITEIVNASSLKFVLDNDFETLHLEGDIVVTMEIPNVPIKMKVDILRWERSQWVPTIISLKRDDFCNAIQNPFEAWHILIMEIPKDQLTCPPKLGHVFNLENIKNKLHLKNMPRWDVDGELKAVVNFSVGELKTCLLLHFTVQTV